MPLLDPKPGALRPHPADGPSVDRASATPDGLRDALVAELGPEKVLHTISDLVRYASDAGPYRLVPRVVVIAETTADVAVVLRHARDNGFGGRGSSYGPPRLVRAGVRPVLGAAMASGRRP
ncbi:hypothetical protein GCM10010300_07970 [Streptomyces olivaceoviridis]|nr:hypothetical protein GCM10010300_07970 [Streptomyces olivaceoviridis]